MLYAVEVPSLDQNDQTRQHKRWALSYGPELVILNQTWYLYTAAVLLCSTPIVKLGPKTAKYSYVSQEKK
jgi:hypothetical protein